MGLLEQKVCIITGGAGSVGLTTARAFLLEGARVMLIDLRDSDLARAAQDLDSANVATYAADVSQAAATKAYIEATVTKWGKIDVLFSNAGTWGVVAPVYEFPEDVFDSVIAVHVRGAFLACRYGLPQMNDGGSIIIMSSVAAVRGDGGGACAYVTAKYAQVGLMRSAVRWAARRNIRVNTLHPGPIDNEFSHSIERGMSQLVGFDVTTMLNLTTPLRRHAHPDEIARAVLFLASDQSSFTTGTMLIADGGLSA
jgi:NAD(P)-dependent dehydrogenase (short-subunit alcohol dehydrogenase family)